jgi:hypothetical protein
VFVSNVKSALSKRFEKNAEKPTKMDRLAEQTSSGTLSSFSGVFKVDALSFDEKEAIKQLLDVYKQQSQAIDKDLEYLCAITSEVKAINNQAIILHGERIKKAQSILINYKDGAFSQWLLQTYGNRQTPYNFLQYYEFYISSSEAIQKAIDLLPKQVIYTLASRAIIKEIKEEFILSYKGETKAELLAKIRDLFPLDDEDKRSQKIGDQVLEYLKKTKKLVERKSFKPTKKELSDVLESLESLKTLCLEKKVF